MQPGHPVVPIETDVAPGSPTDAHVIASGTKGDDPLLALAVAEEQERCALPLGYQPPFKIGRGVQKTWIGHGSFVVSRIKGDSTEMHLAATGPCPRPR